MSIDVPTAGAGAGWLAADEYVSIVARAMADRGFCTLPEFFDFRPCDDSSTERDTSTGIFSQAEVGGGVGTSGKCTND
ncbi:hypothetical protein [Streptomyces sp. NRRL S-1022]|uniref:hypothetical protein n=1 Tax=Streptomyces sp. NRRL S-1022 TaxID=1463880 RepID=UPI0004C17231|nr:hypothetical protein [Streptomyces sp. NRRL S-1022]